MTTNSQTSDFIGLDSPKENTPQADDRKSVVSVSPITDNPGVPLTVREAVARYITLRVAEGIPEDGDTYRHMVSHLAKRLCAAFGDTPLKNVKADHLRMWVTSLKNSRTGKPLEPLTLRHHLIAVKTFFRRAWREGWVERDPTLPLVLPHVDEHDVNIISVKEAFHFFQVNRDHRAIGRVALEAFGGIRYTTAGKITKDEIKFDRKGIEMPSHKHKSKKRKFRQGHPANLWAWLEHAPDECWSLSFRQYREEKKEMLVMAGLRPLVLKTDADRLRARVLKNVWRHSFASYLLAVVKFYHPVSYLMQHTTAKTTEVYEGIADEVDGALYQSITPKAVGMSWADFQMVYATAKPAAIAHQQQS